MTADHVDVPVLAPSPGKEIESMLRAAATAAPGGRPFRVCSVDGGIEVYADPHDLMPSGGPKARDTCRAVGAAVQNIRIAVAVQGRRPVTTLLPDVRLPGLLAVVRYGPAARPTPAELALWPAVPRMQEAIAALSRQPVPTALRHLLRRAAEAEGSWLRSLTDPGEHERVAALVPPVAGVRAGGTFVAVGVHDERAASQLQGGQAIQRVLLTAAVLGLHATVLTGPTALQAAISRAESAGGLALRPHALILVGYPATAPRSDPPTAA